MTTPYTCKQLTDVQDPAPGFCLGDFQQVRFATDELDAETTGCAHLRIRANTRPSFAHRHDEAEEVCLVLLPVFGPLHEGDGEAFGDWWVD